MPVEGGVPPPLMLSGQPILLKADTAHSKLCGSKALQAQQYNTMPVEGGVPPPLMLSGRPTLFKVDTALREFNGRKSSNLESDNIRLAIGQLKKMLIVCDSWFGNKSLVDQLSKQRIQVQVLSRLRKSSRFHNPTIRKQPPGKRGRKPKYGNRLPSLKRIAKALRKRKAKIFVLERSDPSLIKGLSASVMR